MASAGGYLNLPDGVIGNTTDSGSVILGSSPSRAALRILSPLRRSVAEDDVSKRLSEKSRAAATGREANHREVPEFANSRVRDPRSAGPSRARGSHSRRRSDGPSPPRIASPISHAVRCLIGAINGPTGSSTIRRHPEPSPRRHRWPACPDSSSRIGPGCDRRPRPGRRPGNRRCDS